jgi:hypothetical protein
MPKRQKYIVVAMYPKILWSIFKSFLTRMLQDVDPLTAIVIIDLINHSLFQFGE